MILPRILIIDDQYASDKFMREAIIENAGIIEIPLDSSEVKLTRLAKENIGSVASAVFCSGQKETVSGIVNDYELIKEMVAKGWGKISKFNWDLVLLDVRFDSKPIKDEDDKFGEMVRDRLKQDFPDLPLVMFSSKGESDIESSKTTYLSKEGLNQRELTLCLLKYGKLTNEQTRSLLKLDDDVIAASSAMLEVYRKAFDFAETDESVLILGDSGSGKEKVARYIHQMSPRREGPFVTINVAAIPDTLLESELFGVIANYPGFHNKVEKIGLFEKANCGTLFLDEIGDMPPSSQVKILRALQEKTIFRLGGTTPIPLNNRVLSATARNLNQKIEKGEFLNDLLHRIGTLPINIPPLREHEDDIVPLAESFLRKFTQQQNKKGISLSDDAKLELEKLPFEKNNVRELENLIKLLVSTTGNNRVVKNQDVTAAMNQLRSTPPPLLPPRHEEQNNSALHVANLQTLADVLNKLQIDKDDQSLSSAKKSLEDAFHELMKRIAGAALERSRNPVTQQLNRQEAMRLITGDNSLKGKGPGRVINEILGKKQDDKIDDQELEALVELWADSNNKAL